MKRERNKRRIREAQFMVSDVKRTNISSNTHTQTQTQTGTDIANIRIEAAKNESMKFRKKKRKIEKNQSERDGRGKRERERIQKKQRLMRKYFDRVEWKFGQKNAYKKTVTPKKKKLTLTFTFDCKQFTLKHHQ